LSEDRALVLTTDFFTPIVDDPYTFGAVAAANALSDVYSMGGRALSALAIAAFPDKKYPIEVLTDIIQGAVDKCAEGGCVLIGGHTVKDDELKFGLAVAGEVHPQKIITNAQARAGDLLLLTKPLGIGIISTALKGGVADQQAEDRAIENMLLLNAIGAEVMQEMGVVCATDITGFGLLGHSWEMAKASGVSLAFDIDKVPFLPKAVEYAEMGLVPGGLACNREFVGDRLLVSGDIAKAQMDLLFDPQTSGGLLICSSEGNAEEMVRRLREKGYPQTAIIGEVLTEGPGKLIVR
jgi:selenide,water dikinase